MRASHISALKQRSIDAGSRVVYWSYDPILPPDHFYWDELDTALSSYPDTAHRHLLLRLAYQLSCKKHPENFPHKADDFLGKLLSAHLPGVSEDRINTPLSPGEGRMVRQLLARQLAAFRSYRLGGWFGEYWDSIPVSYLETLIKNKLLPEEKLAPPSPALSPHKRYHMARQGSPNQLLYHLLIWASNPNPYNHYVDHAVYLQYKQMLDQAPQKEAALIDLCTRYAFCPAEYPEFLSCIPDYLKLVAQIAAWARAEGDHHIFFTPGGTNTSPMYHHTTFFARALLDWR